MGAYAGFFLASRTLAHLAREAAAIFARDSADRVCSVRQRTVRYRTDVVGCSQRRTASMSNTDRYTCPMCGKPINLDLDETADEDGQVMHADCYFRRIGGHGFPPPDDHHTE
jgi:hypothetical protein